MKLHIDSALCAGHGRCYTLEPQLIQADDEGFPVQLGQTIEVAQGLEDAAQKVVANCPEGAVTVVGE